MKKMEIIDSALAEAGMTPNKLVRKWTAEGKLKTEFLEKMLDIAVKKSFDGVTFIPAKKFVTPEVLRPGMFCYADGLIYPVLIPNLQVSAIVTAVEENRALAMGLREAELPWSSDSLCVKYIPANISGKEATRIILQEAEKQGKKAEAAAWCAAYNFDGIEAGTAFLPTFAEWKRMYAEERKFGDSLDAIELASGLRGESQYWTAEQQPDSFADNGILFDTYLKQSSQRTVRYLYHVRCVIEIPI